ncbi:MAG: DUF1801 domain-containing protein [Actinomycetota bacterium]|nr:DUF1801 domain-containing protein [Actinomycetota bacterium]
MKRDDRSPEHYRRSVEGTQSELLEAVRALVLEAAPDIEEGIRYGMLDYPGLANLAAQKQYVSLYVTPAVLARHAKTFAGVDRGKSCLRFKRLDQVDAASLRALLADVLAARADDD